MFCYRLREFLAAVMLLLRCMPRPAGRPNNSWAALKHLHNIICHVNKS
jgi:hypothetical protein